MDRLFHHYRACNPLPQFLKTYYVPDSILCSNPPLTSLRREDYGDQEANPSKYCLSPLSEWQYRTDREPIPETSPLVFLERTRSRLHNTDESSASDRFYKNRGFREH